METLHILIRVSTSSQEVEHGGTSLITQKQQGIELSKKLNMKYQIHDEGGTSSSKDTLDNRPVMLNLLRLMDEGISKHLWVVNTDRISRGFTLFLMVVSCQYTNLTSSPTTLFLGNSLSSITFFNVNQRG